MDKEITRQTNVTVAGHQSPVTAYLASLTSPASRRTMLGSLERIARMATADELGAEELAWERLTYAHTAAIRTGLIERFGKPATINVMLSALRGVLKACWRLDLMSSDEYQRAADVLSVKAETLPRGRALDGGELRALFNVCAEDRTAAGRRDAAILALLYGAGLRRAEVVSLDVDDYDRETGALKVRQGKGRKERMAYLSSGARQAVEAWLDVRAQEPGPLLGPVRKGGEIILDRMTAQAVYSRLRSLASRAGIKDFSPHDLRRSFVSDLLDAGADASMVQKLAGHSDLRTTLRYDRRPEQAKQKAASLLHVPYSDRPL